MVNAFPIAIVDRAGALSVFGAEVAQPANRLADEGRWPAWAPGGAALAASSLENEDGQLRSRVHIYAPGGASRSLIYESAPGVLPVIAPRLPHYLSWSPDGRRLGVVAQGPAGLQLTLHSFDGADPCVVASGAPIFSSWSPDGSRLAVHAAAELTVVDGAPPHSRHILEQRALGFRVPAWSPSGEDVLYAIAADAGVAVMSFSVDAGEAREVARFDGGVALSFAPGGSPLYVCVTRNPEAGVFDDVWAVDPGTGTRQPVARGPFVAMTWSPAGDRFALVLPAQTGDGRYYLQVYDRKGTVMATAEAVVPSQDMRTLFGFFDQYGLSHPLWAPDGSALLLSGRHVHDAVSNSFGDPVGNLVLRWAATRGTPLEVMAPGDLGFYAPP